MAEDQEYEQDQEQEPDIHFMNVAGKHFRTIWLDDHDVRVLQLIDQRFLPHRFVIEKIATVGQMAAAIREMHVRGAGLIGAAAGFGLYLAVREAATMSASPSRQHS